MLERLERPATELDSAVSKQDIHLFNEDKQTEQKGNEKNRHNKTF